MYFEELGIMSNNYSNNIINNYHNYNNNNGSSGSLLFKPNNI